MKRLIVVALTTFLFFGCQSTKEVVNDQGQDAFLHRNDDGQQCVDEQELVERAYLAERKMRRGMRLVDFGSPDRLFLVCVEDIEGRPIADASMDVRFYVNKSLVKAWSGLSSSERGEIWFFAPGHFGPMRPEFYVISAPGRESRMLKKSGAETGDALYAIKRSRLKDALAKDPNKLKDWAILVQGGPISGTYDREAAYFYLCERRIVLRKQAFVSRSELVKTAP